MKPKLTKTIVGVWTTSIVASSCSVDSIYQDYNIDEDSIYGVLTSNNAIGESLYEFEDAQSDELLNDRVKLLSTLINKIISDESVFERFKKDPNEYIKENIPYVSCDILLPEDVILLEILTNKELQEAIRTKDFNRFVKECDKNNYFNVFKNLYKDINNSIPQKFIQDAQFLKDFFKTNQLNADEGLDLVAVAPFVFYIVALACIYVGGVTIVAATMGAVSTTAFATTVVGDEEVGGGDDDDPVIEEPDPGSEEDGGGAEVIEPQDSLLNLNSLKITKVKDPVVRVWNHLNLSISDVELYNYIREQVKMAVEGYKSNTECELNVDKAISVLTDYLFSFYGAAE